MFSAETYKARRQALKAKMGSGVLLFLGNEDSPMNYTDNVYHFRQDTSFLYYFGIDKPGLVGLIDVDNDKDYLFGNDINIEYIVWMGEQPSMRALADSIGVEETMPLAKLTGFLAGKEVHYLPPYRALHLFRLGEYLGNPPEKINKKGSESLIHAVIAQRSYKTAEEIVEMDKAVTLSGQMHVAAMKTARAGMKEAELAGLVEGMAVSGGGGLAYPVILSVNGQILHNHYHGNTLQEGQLVLGDFGAQTTSSYAGDITRTFPVSKRFSSIQKDIYNIVLKAEVDCIEALKPNVLYKDVHLQSCRIIAQGLKDLGLMKGDIEEAVAAGAHALFFPHGLGHMIGMDVHDMEGLGEDYVGYTQEIRRSTQFGLKSLRLGKALEAGFVLTVEPGIYFIPQLIDKWQAENKHNAFINYSALGAFRDFGGIRIEDNVLVTETGFQVLGQPIPKTVQEIEALRR